MAEDSERKHQYTYGANSNLVIQRDRTGPREVGPSGEVNTLSGIHANKLQAEFGSRVGRDAGGDLAERVKKAQKKRKRKKQEKDAFEERASKQARRRTHDDILDANVDTGYRPRTSATRIAYTVFLDLVRPLAQHDSSDVIKGTAEELLSVFKDDAFTGKAERRAIEETLLGRKPNELKEGYDKLYAAAKKITDFAANPEEDEDNEPEDYTENVPVLFNDSDDNDTDVGSVHDEEEDLDSGDESGGGASGDEARMSDEENGDADGAASEMRRGDEYTNGDHPMTHRDLERRQRERDRMAQANAVLKTDTEFNAASNIDLDDARAKFDVRDVKAYWLQQQISFGKCN